jgi:LCP family protein required for cell wall assembly
MPKTNKQFLTKDRWCKIIKYGGITLAALEIIMAGIFIWMLFWLDMLTPKYLIIIISVLIVLSALCMLSQFLKVRALHWIGKAIALILTVVLIIGCVWITQAKNMVSKISNNTTTTDVVSIYVLKDDTAKEIVDIAADKLGYVAGLNEENSKKCIKSVENKTGEIITTKTYDSLNSLIDALYKKEVRAAIINEAYISTIGESYPNFDDDTRVLDYVSYVRQIKNTTNQKKFIPDTFTIYLSGNDESGTLNQVGKSDVNIMVVINPTTKQILLVNTPRDYYIDVNSLTSGIGKDKLTHAGNFGVDASMKTLSTLYNNWPIDYYVRINFTSVERIVDSLGGITVNSPVAFTAGEDASDVPFTFRVGENRMNGVQALAYCRERNAFLACDNQRGKNQMAVVSAIVDKVASPAILYNYASILDSISKFFQTNLTDDNIEDFVKLTMDTSTNWNVQSYAVSGTSLTADSYFFSNRGMSTTQPDMKTVNTALILMNKIKNGEVYNVDAYVTEHNS